MKLTEAKSVITGVHLGELKVNLIRDGLPPMRAKFALLNKDGGVVGLSKVTGGWSERAITALREFAAVLEEEAIGHMFEGVAQAAETPKAEATDEPPQF